MKGRNPADARRRAMTFGASCATLVMAGCALVGCGGRDDGTEVLPAESVVQVDSELVATEATPVVVSTAAPTTAAPTTLAPTTVPVTTAAPTVVETLPIPADPPPPRSEEPYVELGTLEIPTLDIVQPMLEGISLNTLDLGPGHWPGTAMPGKLGNVVIAGHRTSKHKVFRHLDDLAAGDQILFSDANGEHTYAVTSVEIVGPDAVWIVDPTETPTLTLFACHPPGSTAQRIVVYADLVV